MLLNTVNSKDNQVKMNNKYQIFIFSYIILKLNFIFIK